MRQLSIFLLLFLGYSICVCAQEPAWWTKQKKDCGLSSSLAYNTWVAQGMPCNVAKPSGNSPSTNSSSDESEALRKKEEADKKAKEEADKKAKAEAEAKKKTEEENKKALERMKGSSSKDFGIKTAATDNGGLKGEPASNFGLKSIGQKENEEKQIKETILKTIQGDSIYYKSQLRRIMSEVDKIFVPAPPKPRIIHEGIILGLFNTQEINAVKHVRSPFTGKEYKDDEFFATSDEVTAWELLRGVVDNSYLGEYTLNTEWGKKLVTKLEGTHFDRLIAHSNGATVSEALIRKGIITVDELNIVGGDRSLINYFGYNELIASGKVKRVVVWLNPGDLIPYGSSAGLFSTPLGPRNQYMKTAEDYFILKLTGQNKGGDTKVEYRFLMGSQYAGQVPEVGDIFDAHGLDTYIQNMKTYFDTQKK